MKQLSELKLKLLDLLKEDARRDANLLATLVGVLRKKWRKRFGNWKRTMSSSNTRRW
ncbi:hypothetical protein HMSSN139_34640 [Paenibacillus sp. HMSSN-139]|nr:hypothetical protein HMSSN139_34640 [Paenibacillus sp. HMSSN-139]